MLEIEVDKIDFVVKEVLKKVEVSSDHAKIISDTILFAHKTGKGTHGITRLPIYVKKINNGSLDPKNQFTTIKEKGIITILDANNGFGQVVAQYASEKAVEKANLYGAGIVGVRNSNNFGTAAYFLDQIARKGMIGLIFTNSAPAIAPWGGSKPLFGTNPIGYGFPVGEGKPPIIFDMATSFAARGKIRLAAKNNEKIPFGWALDSDGNPTDDPNKALKGTLVPIGEHKGSGLSLVVDILAGLITGSAFAGEVKPLNTDGEFSKNGHFIMAINVDFFMEYSEYLSKMSFFISQYKESSDRNVVYPGENAHNNTLKNQYSITLKEKPIQEINELLRDLDIDLSL